MVDRERVKVSQSVLKGVCAGSCLARSECSALLLAERDVPARAGC